MSAIKALGAGIGGVVGIILLVLIVVALGSIVGGLVGAGIAAGYNILFGTAFSVWKFALIGSIVGVAGGGASASSE
jgi:hypothetical protein